MDEYKPTEEDLKDFREFCKEREKIEFCGRKRNMNIYKIHRLSEEFRITRIALIEMMKSLLAVLDEWKPMSLLERLNVFRLFGYDPKELLFVINSDFTDEEIKSVLEGRAYQYLLGDLKSVVGDYSVESAASFLDYAGANHILPYTIFDRGINALDVEDMLAREELIERTSPSDRPIFWVREFILTEGEDKGYWSYPKHTNDVVDVTFKRFMKMLLFECQNISETMNRQFGIKYAYIREKKKTKHSVVLSRYSLDLISTYFNVRFKSIPTSSKNGYAFVFDSTKNTIITNPRRCVGV